MNLSYMLAKIEEDEDTGCWLWQGNMHHNLPRVNNREKNMPISARRVMYELSEGPLPTETFAGRGRKCDARCVNPLHTVLRTQKAHMKAIRPLTEKVRTLTAAKISATKRAKSKITDAMIAGMRADFPVLGVKATAKKWGISQSYASYIREGRYRTDPLSLLAQMRRAA